MGGCCCHFALNNRPNRGEDTFTGENNNYCPELSSDPFSSSRGLSSGVSSGLLSDLSLEQSVLDIYRALPAPLPYDSDLASAASSRRGSQRYDSKRILMHQTSSQINEGVLNRDNTKEKICLDSGENTVQDLVNEMENETSKSRETFSDLIDEMDDCPICLEEYDDENPMIETSCEHHFHLSCILQWMERSDICPICDQTVVVHRDSCK